jgi:hypothetical protein
VVRPVKDLRPDFPSEQRPRAEHRSRFPEAAALGCRLRPVELAWGQPTGSEPVHHPRIESSNPHLSAPRHTPRLGGTDGTYLINLQRRLSQRPQTRRRERTLRRARLGPNVSNRGPCESGRPPYRRILTR